MEGVIVVSTPEFFPAESYLLMICIMPVFGAGGFLCLKQKKPMKRRNNTYLTGFSFRWYQVKALFRAWQIARQSYPGRREAWTALKGLIRNNLKNNRFRHLTKAVRVEGRTYSMISMPGRPSPGMDALLRNELHRIVPIPGFTRGLILLFLAMTKKCSMRCEHCYEWENLNRKDVLSVDDLLRIIRKFQARGLSNVDLCGGEPLNRFDDLLEVLRRSDTLQSDFWVVSSGYRLTAERAQLLKAAGLRGIAISLDHWDALENDRFRGLKGAFDWALAAAANAREAGLVVALNLMPTRAFCTADNLWHYLELAKTLRVHFVRIFEPRAVGHYSEAGDPVELDETHWAILEKFHRTAQTDPKYRDYPLIEYHGTFQRQVGCGGAGERYLYIDTDGDFNACPLCRHKCGNALNNSVEEGLAALRQASGCHAYHLV